MNYDLSILIPARNEMFLAKTIDNILENIEANTEIIVGLDGEWANPPIKDHPRVTLIYYPESIGQRALTNRLCSLSSAKYVMKVDAHCAFDKGFDRKLLAKMQDTYTMVPIMKNLHAFDWVCQKCGSRWYQGPTPTFCCQDKEGKVKNPHCDSTQFKREIIWQGKSSPNSKSYCFDSTPHFQYFSQFEKREEYKKQLEAEGLTESMSLQGSCFLMTREKYWQLNICDESFGSWGSQGIEVACKTWLSGGRVVCNHDTWYAHMFRTQGGDFGFPYPLPGSQVQGAKKLAQSLFMKGEWPQQVKSLSWLLQKFWPVPGWEHIPAEIKTNQVETEMEDDLDILSQDLKASPTRGIIFYTDNQLNLKIAHKVQTQLKKMGLAIVSASLKPMNFGTNVYLPLKRGYVTMSKQILAALKASTADIVYFCEHDVLYHPSHFDFVPLQKNKFYYNENVWKIRLADGHAIHYDCKQLSGMSVWRETAIKHYQKRIELLEQAEQSMTEAEFSSYVRAVGFEPGTHNRQERVDDLKAESYFSQFPNVDIRHQSNLTSSRWSQDQFRNKNNCQNWIEAEIIPGWEKLHI